MAKTVSLPEQSERKQRDLLWQKRVYAKNDMREFQKLCRLLGQLTSGRSVAKPPNRSGISRKQNCVVKLRRGKTTEGHLKFLKEYLPQENKKDVIVKPELFSDKKIDDEFIEKYKTNMTNTHYKFIISPENQNVDCEALVKTITRRMEFVTGYKLSWLAAVHTDTAHSHAHLLINGKDKNGKAVIMDNTFITQTIRAMTREACTQMAGPRSMDEIAASKAKLYKSCRFCELDEELAEKEELFQNGGAFGSRIKIFDENGRKRLNFLVELGFAKPDENNKNIWLLRKNWKEGLKASGRYNSFLKARTQLRFSSASDLCLYTKDSGGISGMITKIYRMNEEDSWNHAALVENKQEGRAWYVPLYYEVKKELLNAEINIRASENQRGLLSPIITVTKWPPRENINR